MSDDNDEIQKVQPTGKRGGKWVTLGLEAYRIPALGFAAIADLQDDVESLRDMGGRPSPEHMKVVAKIVHAAMLRNYPEMTVAEVEDMLDLDNYSPVLSAVLSISGFSKGPTTVGGAPASVGTPPMSH
jgi:hypothetical protein